MIKSVLFFLIAIAVLIMTSCGDNRESGQVENLNGAEDPAEQRRTTIRMRQYKIQGKTLYNTECAQCHQEDGSGFAQLYPPLKDSDYLQESPGRTICLIKNGLSGEITVNGKTYSQAMPAHDLLTDLEIAEIMTYLYTEWGTPDQQRLYPVKEVTSVLQNCSE
ncbi:cytochrome c [Roseivirga sp. BDSF3-8]|uniref:c-type cytochrome n=1 Tax=Roseivirga sp. BDSF3-8 TaxID=3241598 RepID=UPI003531A761